MVVESNDISLCLNLNGFLIPGIFLALNEANELKNKSRNNSAGL